MPLQFPEVPRVADTERDEREAMCRQTRQEWQRKYALFRTLLLVFGVVAALALARVMQGG